MDKGNMAYYIMEYYSTIKENGIMLFAGKWMELEIMLTKISQIHKDKNLYLKYLICPIYIFFF
jgi:hypothetical protein